MIEKRGKHTRITVIQNASGNGIDVIALDRRGNITVFEVKGHLEVGPPKLSKLQRADLKDWAKKILNDVKAGNKPYTKRTPEMKANAEFFLDKLDVERKKIHAVVLNVDNALSEFPNVKVFRQTENGLTVWPPK